MHYGSTLMPNINEALKHYSRCTSLYQNSWGQTVVVIPGIGGLIDHSIGRPLFYIKQASTGMQYLFKSNKYAGVGIVVMRSCFLLASVVIYDQFLLFTRFCCRCAFILVTFSKVSLAMWISLNFMRCTIAHVCMYVCILPLLRNNMSCTWDGKSFVWIVGAKIT